MMSSTSKAKTKIIFPEPGQLAESPSTTLSTFDYGAVWLVLIVAALIRIILLFDFCRSNPLAGFVQGDPGVYWQAAGRIASGIFVADTPFQFTPLYPYLLAVVRLFGGGLVATFLLQNMAHLLTGYLLGRLACGRFGRAAGMVVMTLFFLMQEPAVLVNRILPGTWQLLALAAVVTMTHAYAQRENSLRAIMTGLLMGALVLLYPPAVLLVPVLFYQVWRGNMLPGGADEPYNKRAECKTSGLANRRFQQAAAATGSAMLVISFATLHNWLACGELIPLTAHAGITLRQGNAPGSDGRYTSIAGISQTKERMHEDSRRAFHRETGREGSFREIDGHFRDQAWRYMLDDPLGTIRLMLRKAYWFATGRHYGDIYFPTLEQQDGWLRWLVLTPLHTAWLVWPAMLGLAWLIKRRQLFMIEISLLLLPLLVVVVFWYSPRYRFPALPMLCLLAGVVSTSVVRVLIREKRRYGNALILLTYLSIGIGLTAWNEHSGFDQAASYRGVYEYNRGQLFVGLGQHEQALAYFEKAYELSPDRHLPLSAMTASLAALGRYNEAIETAQRLVSAHPEVHEAWLTLGGLYLRIGQWSTAESAFRSLLEMDPNNSPAHLGIWLSLANSGQAQVGIIHLEKAVELDPHNDLAIAEYGLWLARTGDLTRAKKYLSRALERLPDRSDVQEVLRQITSPASQLSP